MFYGRSLEKLTRVASRNGRVLQRRWESTASQDFGVYPGDKTVPYVTKFEIIKPTTESMPAYRVLDGEGKVVPGATLPDVDEDEAVRMYKVMCRVQAMDQIFYDAQRQGRISFYMTNTGEEALQVGSSAALSAKDMIFAQYREMGVLMYREFPIQQFADQCFSNVDDLGKGRQMPIHYGSKQLNFQTISSPLTTQLPQAVGAAYFNKLQDNGAITCTYFGDGAASEGDFHAAMNFAATLECPMLFFCRNNGFAISTGVDDQFRGDGIASRAAGYGMHTIRVDGNDLMAVYDATKQARALALAESKPVLIEAMTYRGGHHSTSDDSTRYREASEIKDWNVNRNPVTRFRSYLESQGWWTDEQEQETRADERLVVLQALEKAEKKQFPSIDNLFTDVYKEMPPNLKAQQQELIDHLAKYPSKYPMKTFNSIKDE